MKLAILTLHRVYNYGSVLQAYATQSIFESKGFETYIVDYITPQRTLKRKLQSPPPKNIAGLVHNCFKPVSVLIKELTFGRFVKKHLHLTAKCIDVDDLLTLPSFDIYVTGSDQTWNSQYNEGIDKGFFLAFTESSNKYAFAASFGKNELEDNEIEETKAYLKKYKAISVREQQGVEILKRMDINNAIPIIDPTLQILKEEWLKLSSKRLIKKKYLLLMLLYNEDNSATEYARRIADDKGLLLVKLSWDIKKPKMVDKLMTHRSPSDFISLFNYADFVVTNSFHGLAFCINLNKQFVIVPRNEFNSRIENLLTITGLESRMVSSYDNVTREKDVIIDYSSVNERIENEREKARAFINANFVVD